MIPGAPTSSAEILARISGGANEFLEPYRVAYERTVAAQQAAEMLGMQEDESRQYPSGFAGTPPAQQAYAGTPRDRVAYAGAPPIPLSGPVAGELGRVTDYGQRNDRYKDSASGGYGKYAGVGPTGAWDNSLRDTSLAVSPDVEAQFRAAGVRPQGQVRVRLSDGSEVLRTWDDRTMQDADAIKQFGRPLRGRFDFYNRDGPDPRRDLRVVGFEPVAPASLAPANRSLLY